MNSKDAESMLEDCSEELPELIEKKRTLGYQKYSDMWTDASSYYLYRRMQEELYEFRQAVEHDQDKDEAMKELADVVNFGLMFLVVEQQYFEEKQ